MTAFSLLAGLGASLGLWQVMHFAQPQHIHRLLDFGLTVLLVSLLGGRVFFVTLHAGYYALHPLEGFYFWQGGLSWPGAAAGALLALVLIALLKRRSLAWLADGLAPLLGPLSVGVWLGCWQSGVSYGNVLPPSSYFAVPALDETGQMALRFPLQILCALGLLVYVWLVDLVMARMAGKRSHPGLKASLFGLGLGLDLLAASLLRADPSPYWGSLAVDTWCAIALAGLSALGLLISLF